MHPQQPIADSWCGKTHGGFSLEGFILRLVSILLSEFSGFFTAFKLWNRLLALAKCTLCGWFTRLVWDTKTQLRKRKPFGPFSRSRSFVRNWKPSARKCAFQGCFFAPKLSFVSWKTKKFFFDEKRSRKLAQLLSSLPSVISRSFQKKSFAKVHS